MKIESFQYTPAELAEFSTRSTHDTLNWLCRNKYIDNKTYNDLTNRLIVTAIPNRKGYGRQLLDRFFGNNEKDESAWVFPIVDVDPFYSNKTKKPITEGATKGGNNVIKLKE